MNDHVKLATEIVNAPGERPVFQPGDPVRILNRSPIGHYRVPLYLHGKNGKVETIIQLAAIDNEEEGYGRNAGSRLHYYRVAIPMTEIWSDYAGSVRDGLFIEIFETWLKRIEDECDCTVETIDDELLHFSLRNVFSTAQFNAGYDRHERRSPGPLEPTPAAFLISVGR